MSTQVRHRARRSLTAGVLASSVLVLGALPTQAAAGTPAPDPVSLMAEFEQYWSPTTYDTTSAATKAATAFRGTVLPAGVDILRASDATLLDINHRGAADTTQSHRALVDADYNWKLTLPDALGPVLGAYFAQGVSDGDLPLSSGAIDAAGTAASTGTAKPHFNFPRPFMADRTSGGDTDLLGLDAALDIHRIPDWTDPGTGLSHTAGYDSLLAGFSQAFPSGHTTYAYTVGLELATLLPELAPEIVTRSSEAGNNRIVLGVHYPLDVMGGRIIAHSAVAASLSDPDYVTGTIEPAREELVAYLTSRCAADGHGDTLSACIEAVGADDAGGYTNAFTDSVSTAPVTDRDSALAAYAARMTYGFDQVGAAGAAPVVPQGAEDLLVTAFPTLSADQRRQVLADTEIDSGYPLDSSSLGWQRIDLPAALSSTVTVDEDGAVVSVEPGQAVASVVVQKDQPTTEPSSTPTQSAPDPDDPDGPTTPSTEDPTTGSTTDPSTTAAVAGSPRPGSLAHTGSDAAVLGAVAALLAVSAGSLVLVARRRARH